MQQFGARLEFIRDVRKIYNQVHKRVPKLLRPRRFTEKMQWRKLFDRNPAFTMFCDKLATRDYVAAQIGVAFLPPLLWSGAEDIPFDVLAPPYYLKSSHASGQVMSVTADKAQDQAGIAAAASAWLQIDYSEQSREPGYKNVPRRLMAEQTLFADGGGPPEERRLFVFDGKVAVVNTVFVEDDVVRNGAFHTAGWERLDWHFTRSLTRDFPKPKRLAEMIRIAEVLGQGIDHIRVDIYDCGDRIFVGELTAYSWGGLACFKPDAADAALGSYWRLRWPVLRAITAMFSATK